MRTSKRKAAAVKSLYRVSLPRVACTTSQYTSDLHSSDGEGLEGLVDSANHHSSFVIPVLNVAAIAQQAAQVVGQQGKSEHPENGQEAINIYAKTRLEYPHVVEIGRNHYRDVGEGRDTQELG